MFCVASIPVAGQLPLPAHSYPQLADSGLSTHSMYSLVISDLKVGWPKNKVPLKGTKRQ